MLALFNSFAVPGHGDITIYPDHLNPYQFYYFKSSPKVSTDKDTGKPMLSYQYFTRDAQKAHDISIAEKTSDETHLGYLTLSVDLGLSEEEEKDIREYLKNMLRPDGDYAATMKLFYPACHKLLKDKGAPASPSNIKLSSVGTCTYGHTQLELLEGLGGSFKKVSSDQVTPGLSGTYPASFYATFGEEGAYLMKEALSSGVAVKGGERVPTNAIVRYNLKTLAYVPSLKAKVTVHNRLIHTLFKNFEQNKEALDTNYAGTVYFKPGGKVNQTLHTTGTYRSTGRKVCISEEAVNNIFRNLSTDSKYIDIKIEDFAGLAESKKDELTDSIISSLMGMITNNVIPSLFDEVPAEFESQYDMIDAKKPASSEEKEADQIYSKSYTLHDDSKIENIQDFTVTFDKSGTTALELSANATLLASIKKEDIPHLVREMDLTNAAFDRLAIPVRVTADFEEDKIVEVDVDIKYDHVDAKSKLPRTAHKTYCFRDGSENYEFLVTMAKDANGKCIEDYEVKSKVIYKGKATLGVNDGWSEVQVSREKTVILSIESLGYLNVKCSAGDIDWDEVKEAVVSLEYTSAAGHEDTKSTIRLSKDNPYGSWTCYKYGNKDNNYSYRVKYIYANGREMESPLRKDSTNNLAIDDMLIGVIKATFDVYLNPVTDSKIKVEVRYEDSKLHILDNFYKWFDSTDSWDWSMRLQQGATDAFKYRYIIQYQDGIVYTSPWFANTKGVNSFEIKKERFPLKARIMGTALDWSSLLYAFVTVKYNDPENNYNVEETVTLNADNKTTPQEVPILAFSLDKNKYTCSAEIIPIEGEPAYIDNIECTLGRTFVVNIPKDE